MDNFILELPDFLSPQLCEMIINRFNRDDTRKEGTYIYNLNRNFITSGKNCIDINITDSTNWGDINSIIVDLSQEAVKKYENHLKKNFDYNKKRHMFERQYHHTGLGHTEIYVEKYEKSTKDEWRHEYCPWNSTFVHLVYFLNTVEQNDDACVEFINGQRIKPERGKLLLYPCSWLLPRRMNTSSESEMYICTLSVGWNYPPDPKEGT